MSRSRIFVMIVAAFAFFALGCETDTQIVAGPADEPTLTVAPDPEPTPVPEPTEVPEPEPTEAPQDPLDDLDQDLVEIGPDLFGTGDSEEV